MQKYEFLFLDFMVQNSHKVYCNAVIENLSLHGEAVVIEKKDYIDDKNKKYKVFEIKTKEIEGNYPFKARYNTVYNFYQAMKVIENMSFEKVIVLGYDPVMFYFMFKRLKKIGDLYLVQHHQLDEVSYSWIKRKMWNEYKDKVHHILLDDSIADLASDYFDIKKNQIHILPHPISNDKVNAIKKNRDKDIIRVLAISQSNDINQMQNIVDFERKTRFFENNKIQIIIRNYNDIDVSGLMAFRVINGFMPIKEYVRLNEMADIILMPFPLDYKFRCSGTLIDALSARKKVISSNIIESAAYAKKFPSICKIYDDVSLIGKQILELYCENDIAVYNDFVNYQEYMKNKGIAEICS